MFWAEQSYRREQAHAWEVWASGRRWVKWWGRSPGDYHTLSERIWELLSPRQDQMTWQPHPFSSQFSVTLSFGQGEDFTWPYSLEVSSCAIKPPILTNVLENTRKTLSLGSRAQCSPGWPITLNIYSHDLPTLASRKCFFSLALCSWDKRPLSENAMKAMDCAVAHVNHSALGWVVGELGFNQWKHLGIKPIN